MLTAAALRLTLGAWSAQRQTLQCPTRLTAPVAARVQAANGKLQTPRRSRSLTGERAEGAATAAVSAHWIRAARFRGHVASETALACGRTHLERRRGSAHPWHVAARRTMRPIPTQWTRWTAAARAPGPLQQMKRRPRMVRAFGHTLDGARRVPCGAAAANSTRSRRWAARHATWPFQRGAKMTNAR